MNVTRQLVVATLFAAFTGGAIAQEATPDSWFPVIGTPKSRSEVIAELQQAQRAGELRYGIATPDVAYRSYSVKTREQVRAEVLAARASGELDALRGEAPAFYVQRPAMYAKVGSMAGQ